MYRVEIKAMILPDQRYIQHHEEKSPNHICHLGQTTVDHTQALHEEPLEHDQSSLCYQGSQLKVTVHHANKIFLIQPGRGIIRLGFNRTSHNRHSHLSRLHVFVETYHFVYLRPSSQSRNLLLASGFFFINIEQKEIEASLSFVK